MATTINISILLLLLVVVVIHAPTPTNAGSINDIEHIVLFMQRTSRQRCAYLALHQHHARNKSPMHAVP